MDVLEIANIIKNNGGKLYLVGGAVRDKFLGIPSKDMDYVVTGLSQNKFEALFPNAKIRGKSFPVYDIDKREFALARVETKVSQGHRGFSIESNESITLQQDLSRRDITINSIAQDVLTNEIIDPFGGLNDLKNKIIKATSNSFIEDALRAYRVSRFASKFQFEVDKDTIALMKTLKDELLTISVERVFEELKKALSTNRPSTFFRVLKEADLLEVHFKEIYDLIGVLQPEKYHPEGDAFEHTMIVLDNVANLTDNLELRFAGLVHDLGKGVTPKELYPKHHGHGKAGVKLVETLCKRLKLPKSYMKVGKTTCKEHMRVWQFYQMSAAKKVDFIVNISKSQLGLEGLEMIANCDKNRTDDSPKIEFAQIRQKNAR